MTAVENKALVQRIMEARARRDHEPFRAAMAEDFVWRIIGSTAWSGVYNSKADVIKRLLRPLYTQFTAPSRINPIRVLADEDYVVVQCEGDATTLSGQRYENTYCLVIRVENGMMKELTEYMDTALVERVLQPPPWHRAAETP
jgi:ketosteroid isomerase-like protein